jgi:ABC-2 type transport system permease protein
VKLIAESSFLSHFMAMERGVIDIRDLVYYGSVIFFMLFVNTLIITNRRAS